MTRTNPRVALKPDPHSCYAMTDSKSIQPEAIIGDVPEGTPFYAFLGKEKKSVPAGNVPINLNLTFLTIAIKVLLIFSFFKNTTFTPDCRGEEK